MCDVVEALFAVIIVVLVVGGVGAVTFDHNDSTFDSSGIGTPTQTKYVKHYGDDLQENPYGHDGQYGQSMNVNT